ncbi:hypothetical protein ACI2L1_39075 [Streptomyces sp. NPDC019531]|uniref:hypothetical protein n=1 Tax=Streptomyces sp. NPDC019531 TaxID=3365062 RepID=UPI00384AA367
MRAPAHVGRGSGSVDLYRLEAGGELVQQIARRLDEWSVENGRPTRFDRINERLVHDVLGPVLSGPAAGTAIEQMLNGGRPVFLEGDTAFGKVEQLVVLKAELGEGAYHATRSRHTSRGGLDTTARTSDTTQSGWSALWGAYLVANPGATGMPGAMFMAGVGGAHSWTTKDEVSKEHTDSLTGSEAGVSVQFLHDLRITMEVHPHASPGTYSKHLPAWMPKPGGRSFDGSWTERFTLPGAARSTVPAEEVLPADGAGPSAGAPVQGSLTEWQQNAGLPAGLHTKALVRRFDAPRLHEVLNDLAFQGREERPVLRPSAGFELLSQTGSELLRSRLPEALSEQGHVIDVAGDALARVTVKADVVGREVVRVIQGGSLSRTATDTSKAETTWTSAGELGPEWIADFRQPTIQVGDETAANRPNVLLADPYSTWLTYGDPESVAADTTREAPKPAAGVEAGPHYLVRLTPRWTVTPAYREKKIPARSRPALAEWQTPITTEPDEPILVMVDQEGLARLGLREPGDDTTRTALPTVPAEPAETAETAATADSPRPEPEPSASASAHLRGASPDPDLGRDFGDPVLPKRVKDEERDDTGEVRANPLWTPLDEIDPALLVSGNLEAVWAYTVTEDGRILLGSEAASSVMPEDQFEALLAGMRAAEERGRETDPSATEAPHTPLTAEALRQKIDGLGHTGLGATFNPDGTLTPGPSRVSGEFRWSPELRSWTVNDKSGRYMSAQVRPDLDPAQAATWVANVAERFTQHLGVHVRPLQIKLAPPAAAPDAQQAAPSDARLPDPAAGPAVRVVEEPMHGIAPLAGHRLRRTDTPTSSRLELVDAEGAVVPDRTVLPRAEGGFVVQGPEGNLHLDSAVRFEYRELELPGLDHVVRMREPAGIDGPLELLDHQGTPVDGGRLARFPDRLTVTVPLTGPYEGTTAEWHFNNQGTLDRTVLPQTGESSGGTVTGRGKAPLDTVETAEPEKTSEQTAAEQRERRPRWQPGLPTVPEGLTATPPFRLVVPPPKVVAQYEQLGLPVVPEVVDAGRKPVPGWAVTSRADGGFTASEASGETRWQFGADRVPQALDVRLAGTEDFLRFAAGEDGPALSVLGADHYELGEIRDAAGALTEVWVSAPGDDLGWRYDGFGVPRDVEVPLTGAELPGHLAGALIRKLRVPVSETAPRGWVAELVADDPWVVASHSLETTSDAYVLTDRVTDDAFRFGTDGVLVPVRKHHEAPWRTLLRRLNEGLFAKRPPRVEPQNHLGTIGLEYDPELARIFDETLPKAQQTGDSGTRGETAPLLMSLIAGDATDILRRAGLDPAADREELTELRAAVHEALWTDARRALDEAGPVTDAAGRSANGFTVLPARPGGLRPVIHQATGLETVFGRAGQVVSHQVYLHEVTQELVGRRMLVSHGPSGEFMFDWADTPEGTEHLTVGWAGDENEANTDPLRQFLIENGRTGATYYFSADGTQTEAVGEPEVSSPRADETEQPLADSTDTAPPRPPHAEAPWYMGRDDMDAHGELNVIAVDPWDEALIRQWADDIANAVRSDGDSAELATGIREGLRTLLRDGTVPEALSAGGHADASAASAADKDKERRLDFWEAALQRGLRLTAGGRTVWLRPVLRDVEPLPATTPAMEQYALNWTKPATTHKSAWEQGWGGGTSVLTALSTGLRVASSVTPAPVIALEAHRTGETLTNRTVAFDRKVFMQRSTPFGAGLKLRIFIDGEERPHDLVTPARLTVQLPKSLTAPGALRPVPRDASYGGEASDAGYQRARTIINAIDLIPSAAELERRLRSSGLPAEVVRAVMDQTLTQLNERSAINQSKNLLSNGLVTGRVSGSTGIGGSFKGHVAIRATVEGLRYLGDTSKVAVREDAANTLVVHRKQGARTGFSLGARVTAGPAEFLSLTGGMSRATGHGLALATDTHTIIQTTEDHARYRASLDLTIEVRSTTHRIEPVTLTVPAELAVPSHEAADFEHRVLGPDATLLRRPLPESAGPLEAHPYVRALLAEAAELGVGLPDSAFRRPERLDAELPEPHEREPLALAARKGPGFGVLLGLPGSELVHDQIRTVIELTHQQLAGRRPKLTLHPPFVELRRPRVNWAGADADLLTTFGRASLETDLAQLMSGIEHSVRLGGRTYHVSMAARLLERVGGITGDEARPMSLNVRTNQGATVTGERKNGWSLRGFVGARGRVELTDQVRLRLGQAGVTGGLGGGTKHAFSGGAASGQRADMSGKVDEHVYNVVYELSVRTDGHPERRWWIDKPDQVVAQVAVPQLHVPQERISREALREAYVTRPLPALPAVDRRVDFAGHGATAVFRSVMAPPEVVRAAAEMYGRANGHPDTWAADPANWPAEIRGLFSPNELVARFPTLTSAQGRLTELPDGPDGWHQALRLRLVVVDPQHVRAYDGSGFKLWQNSSASAKYEHAGDRTRALGLAGRLGPMLHIGHGADEDEESASSGGQVSSVGREGSFVGAEVSSVGGELSSAEQHQALSASVGATFGGGYQWGWETGDSTAVGPVGITRGTYGGPKHTYRADAVFQITLDRWRGRRPADAVTGGTSGTTSDEVTLEVRHGLDFVVPERRIFDLGLPVPEGVRHVEPHPPTDHFDPALLAAGTHPEVLRSDGVLDTMKRWLTEQRLLRPGPDGVGHLPSRLLSGIEASYSPAALLDQFTLLNTAGVTRWWPIPSAFGATRYLWTKVTAATLEPMAQHDRSEMTMVLRGKAVTENTTSASRSTEVEAHAEAHGRMGTSPTGGLQIAGGWSREASTAHERHAQGVGVYWGQTSTPSVEFQLRQRFDIEMALTQELPEILAAPVRAYHGVTLATSSLLGHRRHAAGRVQRDPSFVARFPRRPGEGSVDGWVRVVIPRHTVQPGPAPQPTALPARHTVARWESEERPSNDALVDLLAEHGHPWAFPAAGAVNRWAVLPAAPTTSRPEPTTPESWRPDGSTLFGTLYDHLTNEVHMRLSLEQLLRHRYQVLVGGEKVTVGMRINRVTALPGSEVKILSRHFDQVRDTEEHVGGAASAWFAGIGPVVGGEVDGHSLRDSLPLRYESHGSGEQAAESEEILERNTASTRQFRYYKADVELALAGPHGKLLVDAPGGLYLMLPTDLDDSPALREVLVTEPEPQQADDGDVPGPASGAERPVDPLVEAFLTRINGAAGSDGRLPEPPVPPAPHPVSAPAGSDGRLPEPPVPPAPHPVSAPENESDMVVHQSDGAETVEASAERFLTLINDDRHAADTGSRTDTDEE